MTSTAGVFSRQDWAAVPNDLRKLGFIREDAPDSSAIAEPLGRILSQLSVGGGAKGGYPDRHSSLRKILLPYRQPRHSRLPQSNRSGHTPSRVQKALAGDIVAAAQLQRRQQLGCVPDTCCVCGHRLPFMTSHSSLLPRHLAATSMQHSADLPLCVLQGSTSSRSPGTSKCCPSPTPSRSPASAPRHLNVNSCCSSASFCSTLHFLGPAAPIPQQLRTPQQDVSAQLLLQSGRAAQFDTARHNAV